MFERDGRIGADAALVLGAVLLGEAADQQAVAQLAGVLQAEPAVGRDGDSSGEQLVSSGSPQHHRVT